MGFLLSSSGTTLTIYLKTCIRFSYMKFVQEFFCIIHPVTSNFHMGFLFKLWNNNFDNLHEDLHKIFV
jgi:hypothetical protein